MPVRASRIGKLGTRIAIQRALLASAMCIVSVNQSQAFQSPAFPWHLVDTVVRRETVTIETTAKLPFPDLPIKAVATIPPDLTSQRNVTSEFVLGDGSLAPERLNEVSGFPQQGYFLQTHVSGRTTKLTYAVTATMYRSSWVAGAPTVPPHPLSTLERTLFLSGDRSSQTDFQVPTATRWIGAQHLWKGPAETDVDFALRALGWVASHRSYGEGPRDKRFSHLIDNSASDCGGTSTFYVSLLRANGIPARSCVGVTPEDAGKAVFTHVRSQVWLKDLGWVFVEPTYALGHTDWGRFFGYNDGDLLVTAIDTGSYFFKGDERSNAPAMRMSSSLQTPVLSAAISSSSPLYYSLVIGPAKEVIEQTLIVSTVEGQR